MKYNYFVYLDTKANRLIITNEVVENPYFMKLMDASGFEEQDPTLLMLCKMYCLGYMQGCGNTKPVNDINEFK
jgi:hypothetical protein